MTKTDAESIIAKADSDYSRTKDGKAAREALQEVFAVCFDNLTAGNGFASALEGAYRLLRRIENNSPVPENFGYRYDAGFVLEGLVFCAQVLSRLKGGRFTLDNRCANAFVCIDLKSLCRLLFNLLANAARYSDAGDISVKLSCSDSFAVINVTNSGSFDGGVFQTALCGDGSLGFVNRALTRCGGSVVMTQGGGRVLLSVKIPLCKTELPLILPFPVEDLLYDRLSPAYIAFCAH